MPTFCKLFLSYTICLIALACTSNAQENIASPAVDKLIKNAESYFEKMPSEQLYLHFDKPYYTIGDTMWFKSYLLKSADHTASLLSSKLYVELINDSSKLISRLVIPVATGLGQGYFALSGAMYDGNYHVRSYTNWMQNFGEDRYFKQQFYIGKPTLQGGWLVKEQHAVKKGAAGNQINLALQVSNLNATPVPYRDIELRLIDGRKTLLKSRHTTSDEGAVNSSFTLSPKTDPSKLTLVIDDISGKNSTLNIPFNPNSNDQNVDLQFMPEGGDLIAGLYNKVAFKAVGQDGKGKALHGTIVNSKNEEVITFQALHNGMGSFMLLPQAGETYTANIIAADGVKKNTTLPAVKQSGMALRIDNISRADSINIYITATADVAAAKKTFTLIAQSKEAIHFGTAFKLDKGYNNLRIAKDLLNSGVVSFVILDDMGQPVNERRLFVDRQDLLQVSLANSQATYQPQDSIAVVLNVKDKSGKPVRGNFSVAVTDNGTIKEKGLADNIASRMLLTSELKGSVEDPAWYFTNSGVSKEKALDNLMLTQGWIGYDWKGIPTNPPKFEAEPDNKIAGRLEGIFKKPIKDAGVRLFASSKKYGVILMDTTSNAAGGFAFDDVPLTDTIAFNIKVHNKKGKEMGAGIIVNEFVPAPISATGVPRQIPWYAQIADNLMIRYFNRPNQKSFSAIDPNDVKGKLLNEVVIKAKKEPVKIGGQFGYPIRELDEKELIAAKKRSLLSLMYEKFKNLHISSLYADNMMSRTQFHEGKNDLGQKFVLDNFVLGSRLIADVFVDGQSVAAIYNAQITGDPRDYRNFLNSFFEYIGADDVKDVKVVEGFNTFMVINTRSGNGPFIKISPGNLAYRPLPMLFPKKFYSPRYVVKNSLPDNRTTIFWEPNIVTDEDGKAVISFYAADKPTTYTISVEGTNMTGGFGFQTGKIIINNSLMKAKVKDSK